MATDRERLAASIDLACTRTPSLPDPVPATGAASVYVKHRVAEVLAIWEEHGLHPLGVVISASATLVAKLGSISRISGVPVEVYAMPAFYSSPANEAETFSIDIDADDPAAIWVRPSVGIAYDGPVDPVVFATRWVLQEIDGMDDGDAEAASRSL